MYAYTYSVYMILYNEMQYNLSPRSEDTLIRRIRYVCSNIYLSTCNIVKGIVQSTVVFVIHIPTSKGRQKVANHAYTHTLAQHITSMVLMAHAVLLDGGRFH